MSASLVGSEMCIRDRRRSARPHTHRDERRPQRRKCLEELRARRAAEGGPVSYTHLTLPTICSV
eukprot:773670-Alexandrium_andersonii.AAC.1